jgi:hypothetical protein
MVKHGGRPRTRSEHPGPSEFSGGEKRAMTDAGKGSFSRLFHPTDQHHLRDRSHKGQHFYDATTASLLH